jgi:uncharacterized protein YegP (UPF0339 family)
MNSIKFQVFRSFFNNEYYFRLKSSNGETILSGEGYKTKQACLEGIESVRVNSCYDSLYKRKDAHGNFTFTLVAGNGEIIGKSENYISIYAREKAIDAIKNTAGSANVEV